METSQSSPQKKSGMAVIVGRSNVGKSTLINSLVGQKIAIVTPKPQTTRDTIQGAVTDERGQIVFMDTPGFFMEAGDVLSRKLLAQVEYALKDVDVIVYLVDPTRPLGTEERRLASMVRNAAIPVLLVINKIDVPEKERVFEPDYIDLVPEAVGVVRVSALKGTHLKSLINEIFERLPIGEPLFPEETFVRNERKWISEVIREKLFHTMSDEIPYGLAVRVDDVEKKPKVYIIHATILTNEERHKKMIIGRGAIKLKEIGSSARKEIELYLGRQVFLELHVKEDKNWMAYLT